MTTGRPVGVYDSGMGGLSVLREIRALLPAEDLVYLADSAYCPYGGRSLDEIRERALAIGRFLVEHDAKAIVVACNTASGASLEALRATLDVPIVGMEPAVKPAASTTRNGRVGVLTTEATLRSERFDRLMASYASGIEVTLQPGYGFVEAVEAGELDGSATERVVERAVAPLVSAGVDTVVLGCTHYPFLRPVLARLLGPEVEIIDTGAAVARQLRRVLERDDALAGGRAGSVRIFTTGEPAAVGPVVARLWDEPGSVERVTL